MTNDYLIQKANFWRLILYAFLALLGLLSTWFFNIQFIQQYQGFSVLQFLSDNYVNPASASISNDLWVSVVTFLCWSLIEAKRISMKHWWIYPLLTFSLAVAVAFPVFLFMRERHLSNS